MSPFGWLRRAPLTGFMALTFGWSWACWILAPALKPGWPGLATPLMLAGSFGPSLAAVTVVACTRGSAGLHFWLVRWLQWRIGWGVLAMAVLGPLGVMALAAGAHVALGGSLGPAPVSGHLLTGVLNLFLIFLLGGPVGEEFGWRALALPALQARHGWRAASLVLGVVWGLWHLPLFFIDGTVQARIPARLFLLSVVALSVVLAWLVNRSAGSVVAALLMHTAINFWPAIVPVLPDASSPRVFGLAVGLLVLVAVALLVRPDAHGDVRLHVQVSS